MWNELERLAATMVAAGTGQFRIAPDRFWDSPELRAILDPLAAVFEPCTATMRRCVDVACFEAIRLRTQHVATAHVLLGLLSVPGSVALSALEEVGAPYREVGEALRNSLPELARTDAARSMRRITVGPEVLRIISFGRRGVEEAGGALLDTGRALLAMCEGPLAAGGPAAGLAHYRAAMSASILEGHFSEQ